MKTNTNLTYRQLQFQLKYYRDKCGISLNCKLNAKKVVLEAEYLAIYNTKFANERPDLKVESIFDHKLNKGDLLGAIDQSILDCENTKKIAREAIANIKFNQARLNKLAKDAIAKYQPL